VTHEVTLDTSNGALCKYILNNMFFSMHVWESQDRWGVTGSQHQSQGQGIARQWCVTGM